MMDIESQVCSLELADKLRDLGVKQESFFCWFGEHMMDRVILRESRDGDRLSAFTVAELGEILPHALHIKDEEGVRSTYDLFIDRNSAQEWGVSYMCEGHEIGHQLERNEADARARMLIFLIEKGHVKP